MTAFLNVKRETLVRYLLALGITICVGLLRQAFVPWLSGVTPMLLFLAAVAFSSWQGGFGPGVLSMASSLVMIAMLYLDPNNYLFVYIDTRDLFLKLMLFCIIGSVISCLAGVSRQRKSDLQKALAASEKTNKQLDLLVKKLERQESTSRRLVEANVVGVVVGNFDNGITEANDAFLRIVGYSREDLSQGHIRWRDLSPLDFDSAEVSFVQSLKTQTASLPFEKILKRKDGSKVPVLTIVAMTAHAMQEELGRCLRAGCDDHLVKPVSTRDLVDLVARLVGRGVNLSTEASLIDK